MRKLYNIANYLSSKYEGDIFKYFDATIRSKGQFSTVNSEINVKVHQCQLPLNLIQSMQSSKLIQDVVPNRGEAELNLPINNRKENPSTSWVRHFTFSDGKPKNEKIEQNLLAMKQLTLGYLKDKSTDSLLEKIKSFTF